MADEAYAPTRRGTDERLDTLTRPNADDRLAAKKARRQHLTDEDLYADALIDDEV